MILDEIVAAKREEIQAWRAQIPLAEIRALAENAPPARDFENALRTGVNVALIAEIKPASPSHGELDANAKPEQLARIYAKNGAAAISVLTDRKFFKGEPENLKAARVGAEAPLLRKDFIIDAYQLYESRALEADAILLITRLLDDEQLRDYHSLAKSLGMAALIEIHDKAELERALRADARLIGINNRNLANMTLDLGNTELLAPIILGMRAQALIVSESGIATRADVERASKAGAHAVLVGAALMRAGDVGAKVQELAGVERGI